MRHVHERVRLGVAKGRPLHAGCPLEQRRQALRGRVGERDEDEQPRPAQDDGEQQPEREPDRPPRPDPREPDEHLVERVPPVGDDPALEMAVEGDQAGTSCLIWSRSCCGSNGLPTKPCAPRAAACASSSTLPLNMTTGIAPAP